LVSLQLIEFVETKNLPALPTGRQAEGRDGVDKIDVYTLFKWISW
jgi:hypothetical protein